MEISAWNQTVALLISVGLGSLLGAIYDVIRTIRSFVFFKRAAFTIGDILFCICSAAVMLNFIIRYSSGQLRLFLLVGCIGGFMAYRFILSRPILWLYKKIGEIIIKITRLIFKPIYILLVPVNKKFKIFINSFVNMRKPSKYGLKKCIKLMYNKFVFNRGKGDRNGTGKKQKRRKKA